MFATPKHCTGKPLVWRGWTRQFVFWIALDGSLTLGESYGFEQNDVSNLAQIVFSELMGEPADQNSSTDLIISSDARAHQKSAFGMQLLGL